MNSGSGFPREKAIRTAKWFLVLLFGLFLIFLSVTEIRDLMSPGPLSTRHSSLDQCKSCHTKYSDNHHWWIAAAFSAANPQSDSNKCLTCHSMNDAPLKAHNMSKKALNQITNRLQNSQNNEFSSSLFSSKFSLSKGRLKEEELYCATCHQEHRGRNKSLKLLSEKQCQSCHAIQFKSFEQGHPQFRSYPLKRNAKIQFDHKSHFEKHFSDVKKERQLSSPNENDIPKKCTNCHQETSDAEALTIKPFAKTCRSCHLKQILGKDQAVGPKGVAFFTLPGLDLRTLKEKKIYIGEWPEDSEAEPSAMLLSLLASKEENRSFLNTLKKLDLLDLSDANDPQISAVEKFVWALKKLVFELIWSEKINIKKLTASSFNSTLRPELLSALTADIPRDVLIRAQQEWLPDLKKEVLGLGTSKPKLAPKIKSNPRQEIKKSQAPKAPSESRRKDGTSINGRWRVDPFGKLVKGSITSAKTNAGTEKPLTPENDFKNSNNSENNQIQVGDTQNIEAVDKWAKSGGWFRKDFTIFYSPIGHADRFLKSWLQVTGINPTTSTFEYSNAIFAKLSKPDAPGRCAKCHVLDKLLDKSSDRKLEQIAREQLSWKFSSRNAIQSRLTKFIHKPHLSLMGREGCFSCHTLNKPTKTNNSKTALDTKAEKTSFKNIEKKTCEQCHTKNRVRNDCLLCHNYHSNTVLHRFQTDQILQSN